MSLKKELCITVGVTVGALTVMALIDRAHKKAKEEIIIVEDDEKINDVEEKINSEEMVKNKDEAKEELNAKIIRFESYVNNKTTREVNKSALERATKIINGGL